MSCLDLLIVSSVLCSLYVLGGTSKSTRGLEGWSSSSGHSTPTVDVGRWAEEPWGYSGPTAVPEVLPDGSLADVPEVAAARIAHLTALQAAASDPRADDGDDGSYDVYKYGDNRYQYHDDNSARAEENQAVWQDQTQYKPLPNPHAIQAAAQAWKE